VRFASASGNAFGLTVLAIFAGRKAEGWLVEVVRATSSRLGPSEWQGSLLVRFEKKGESGMGKRESCQDCHL
jgi:hypothetical protein